MRRLIHRLKKNLVPLAVSILACFSLVACAGNQDAQMEENAAHVTAYPSPAFIDRGDVEEDSEAFVTTIPLSLDETAEDTESYPPLACRIVYEETSLGDAQTGESLFYLRCDRPEVLDDGYDELKEVLDAEAADIYALLEAVYLQPEREKLAGGANDEMLPGAPGEVRSDVLLQRCDTKVMSYFRVQYLYLGEGEPQVYYSGHVYDTQTGRRLILWEDVASDYDALYEAVLEKLVNGAAYYTLSDRYEEVVAADFYGDGEPDWGFTKEGLLFVFSAGKVAPESDGSVEVELSYAECAQMVKDEYSFDR